MIMGLFSEWSNAPRSSTGLKIDETGVFEVTVDQIKLQDSHQ